MSFAKEFRRVHVSKDIPRERTTNLQSELINCVCYHEKSDILLMGIDGINKIMCLHIKQGNIEGISYNKIF